MDAVTRPEASPHGPAVPPSEAPEAITQAVASLPPEQMFELMKQMKVFVITLCNQKPIRGLKRVVRFHAPKYSKLICIF